MCQPPDAGNRHQPRREGFAPHSPTPMTHQTRTDAQHDRTRYRTSRHRPTRPRTRAVGVAPAPEADAAGMGVIVAMAVVPFAVAMAASYPTVAAVVVAAVAGAAVQRRYDERIGKRVGVTAASQG